LKLIGNIIKKKTVSELKNTGGDIRQTFDNAVLSFRKKSR